MNKVRCWKLLLTGDTAGLVFDPSDDCSTHPAYYKRVLVVEASALDALRARVAEQDAQIKSMARLLLECRDALPAISLTSARLHGIDLTLADRMEAQLESYARETGRGSRNWRLD